MSTFLSFFWLLTFAVIAANVAVGHRKAAALVAANRVTDDERRDFTRTVLVASAIYCIAQAAIQWAGRFPDPLCPLAFPPRSGLGWAAWAVVVITSLAIIRAVWGPGGEVLTRIAPAYTRGPMTRTYTVASVRVAITGILLVAILGNIGVQLATPGLLMRCS